MSCVFEVDGSDGKARYRRAVALLRLQRFDEAAEEASMTYIRVVTAFQLIAGCLSARSGSLSLLPAPASWRQEACPPAPAPLPSAKSVKNL